jgi:hypothetical protein
LTLPSSFSFLICFINFAKVSVLLIRERRRSLVSKTISQVQLGSLTMSRNWLLSKFRMEAESGLLNVSFNKTVIEEVEKITNIFKIL